MRLAIDFGTSFSSAAFIDEQTVTMVKDPTSSGFSIPSSVYFTSQGKLLVGRLAEQLSQDALRYRRELKRDLGQSVPATLGEHLFQIEELVAAVLGKLKSDADTFMQSTGRPPFSGAVLTVPATYGEHRRNAMLQAATLARFQADQVAWITEPVAAAYYYASRNSVKENDILLVYDLGGGTFDTALLMRQGNTFVDLALPKGIDPCGGIDFDRAISHNLMQLYPELYEQAEKHSDERILAMVTATIRESAIQIKHQLSDLEEAQRGIVVPGTGNFYTYTLTRAAFNQMIATYMQDTIGCCQEMLEEASIGYEKINHILLVGGSCRIPYVRQRLQEEFKQPVIIASDPELIVCQGAAIYANTLSAIKVPETRKAQQGAPVREKPKSPGWSYNSFLHPSYYWSQGKIQALENIKITMLGPSGVGKTSFMLAMYAIMQQESSDFTLRATDSQINRYFSEAWDNLVGMDDGDGSRWPPGTNQSMIYTFDLCYEQKKLLSIKWIDHRGGELYQRSNEIQGLINHLKESNVVMLTISTDSLKKYLHRMISRMLVFLSSASFPDETLKPAIVIVLTKFDVVSVVEENNVTNIIKENLSFLFSSANYFTVMICPVTLGADLRDDPSNGAIELQNVHLPMLFSAYWSLKGELLKIASGIQEKRQRIDGYSNSFWNKVLYSEEIKRLEGDIKKHEDTTNEMKIMLKKISGQLKGVKIYYNGQEMKIDV